uniref:Uncharacterized protein n=1 Tax=Spongospora subterranea TaxID=70186 RepID=A0A0H5R400_9EUKA|eukprot:CRZ02749.1 hypothetical protein [Spongospora subterranea]
MGACSTKNCMPSDSPHDSKQPLEGPSMRDIMANANAGSGGQQVNTEQSVEDMVTVPEGSLTTNLRGKPLVVSVAGNNDAVDGSTTNARTLATDISPRPDDVTSSASVIVEPITDNATDGIFNNEVKVGGPGIVAESIAAAAGGDRPIAFEPGHSKPESYLEKEGCLMPRGQFRSPVPSGFA